MLSKHFLTRNSHFLLQQCTLLHPSSLGMSSSSIEETSPVPSPIQRKLVDDITISNGLPHVTLSLPSRNEKCVFALKPISNNVGDFLAMLKYEDKGIDRAVIKTVGGVRIASNTSIQTLFDQKFIIHINDVEYMVNPPELELLSKEELQKINDVKQLVSQLYEALHVDEYHVGREKGLVSELETLKKELAPLEEQRAEILMHAENRTSAFTWLGLGFMSIQFGVLARLTWWEYSWDIMEPVTYFVTYGTAIAGYAYFVMTRQEFLYPEAKNRQRLVTFHKKAKKHRWDVEKYNDLKRGINAIEADLRRIQNPLDLHAAIVKNDDKKNTSSSGIFAIKNLKELVNKM